MGHWFFKALNKTKGFSVIGELNSEDKHSVSVKFVEAGHFEEQLCKSIFTTRIFFTFYCGTTMNSIEF